MPRRRSGKKIDFTHWTFGAGSQLAAGGGPTGTILLAAQHLPETILRMRGEFVTYLDAAQATPSLVRVVSGLILVPEGTSSTVLWSPDTDSDAPWIWFDVSHIGYEEMVTDVIDVPLLSFARKTIDSKAMRIVKNMELQYVREATNLVGSPNTNTAIGVRVLSGT